MLDSKTRLQILLVLETGERMVHQLVDQLGKSQPLISQHLRVLRKAGFVSATRQGREVVYSLTKSNIAKVIFDLAALLDEAQDDLARLHAKSNATSSTASNAASNTGDADDDTCIAGAAIIDPPSAVRPELDPGLKPALPKPERT